PASDLPAPLVARVDAAAPIDRDSQHRASRRPENGDTPVQRDAVQLSALASGDDPGANRIPCDALRMVEVARELVERLGVDHAAPSASAIASSRIPSTVLITATGIVSDGWMLSDVVD